MKNRRHLGDDLEADEDGEDKDGELVEQAAVVHRLAASASSLARGFTIAPSCVTQAPLTISSLKSSFNAPSLTSSSNSVETFLLYSWLAWTGMVLGRLRVPSIVTPPTWMILPASVSSQFPPVSAARSTMTEPARMRRTMSAVTRIGALRPGMAAAVMTTSEAATRSPISSRCRRRKSSDCSLAY